jgi:putative spermidine/putrescine transport system substrate-binding protein
MSRDDPRNDALAIARRKLARGQIDRRTFLMAASALGLAPAVLRSGDAGAADRIVLVNWGGDAIPAMEDAWAAPYRDETGTRVVIDGSGPTQGAIKAQHKSGAVRWDIVDAETYSTIQLGDEGILRPIDYDIVDRDKVLDGFALDHGVASYFFSYVIAYDSQRFGSNPPKTWADFWDVEKYPGKRTLYKWMTANLEIALMADGVPPEEVYPIDVDRALKKIAELKPHIVTHWGSGAESQQLLRSGEAVMGQVWHTRAELVREDTDGRIQWQFDNGVLSPSSWAVLKGNPAGADAAMNLIAFMQDPDSQIDMLRALNVGPANPAAQTKVPADLSGVNPVSPAHRKRQLALDSRWHAENYDKAVERYLDLVSS